MIRSFNRDEKISSPDIFIISPDDGHPLYMVCPLFWVILNVFMFLFLIYHHIYVNK